MTERARGLGSALRMAADAMARGAWWFRSGEPVAIVLDLLLIVCLAAATVWLRALLRPVQARYGHTSEEHWRAADIVAKAQTEALQRAADVGPVGGIILPSGLAEHGLAGTTLCGSR